ncbi:MAG: hypothetical protein GF363_18130 [Chitinivibrionales bacterium]|nr:hypothetical protein [Chitinivibrionales bacterium]
MSRFFKVCFIFIFACVLTTQSINADNSPELKKCLQDCSNKYDRDFKTCVKSFKKGSQGYVICVRSAKHSRDLCETMCYIDFDRPGGGGGFDWRDYYHAY